MEPTSSLTQLGAECEGLEASWHSIAVGFLVEKARRTDSMRTPEVYGRMVGHFLRDVGDPAAATALDVHRFAYGSGASGAAPAASTICVRLAAVSGFYDFAQRMGVIDRNPASQVRRPLGRRSLPRGLSPAEVARLLAVIPETATGLLDRAIIVTAILTGLRRSELMSLRLASWSTGAATQYEVRTKGGARRRRQLPDPAWLAIRVAAAAIGRTVDRDDPLAFPISDTTFYAHLRRYAQAAGVDRVSPHVLRHTAAKLRRQAGASIEQVASLLGHASIATTAVYLRQLEDEPDNGWAQVAGVLGIGGQPSTNTPTGNGLRPTEKRWSGCANSRPTTWIEGHVHAPLPQPDGSPLGQLIHRGREGPAREPAPRSRTTRPRWTGAEGELSPLRRASRSFHRWRAMAGPRCR